MGMLSTVESSPIAWRGTFVSHPAHTPLTSHLLELDKHSAVLDTFPLMSFVDCASSVPVRLPVLIDQYIFYQTMESVGGSL